MPGRDSRPPQARQELAVRGAVLAPEAHHAHRAAAHRRPPLRGRRRRGEQQVRRCRHRDAAARLAAAQRRRWRRPHASRIGGGQHHPAAVERQRQPTHAALHDARIVAQHHQGRPGVAGHPHQVAVPARLRQNPVVDRERRAPAARTPPPAAPPAPAPVPCSSGIGTASTPHAPPARAASALAASANGSACSGRGAGADKARNRHADRGGRAGRRALRRGMPERHRTTGPGNTSLPVRSRHPAPPAASDRAMRSARTTPPPTSTIGHEPPVGMHQQPLIQRSTHHRPIILPPSDTPLRCLITCAPERHAHTWTGDPANRRSGEWMANGRRVLHRREISDMLQPTTCPEEGTGRRSAMTRLASILGVATVATLVLLSGCEQAR